MCGDSFSQIGMGAAHSLDKYRDGFVSSDIVSIFRSHDMVLCNLEGVLSDVGRRKNSLRSLHMRGRPQAAQYLAKWGITIANVANNHILEQGRDCAIDTVSQLHKAGIRTVGAGRGGNFQSGIDVAQINSAGQAVAVFGVCLLEGKYTFNGGGDLSEVLLGVETCASDGKLVIVSVHWGDELMDRPSLWQKRVGQQFIKAGAKLIIGHHPHVVQGIDTSDSNLIAYSLGNFIFDSSSEAVGWSIILSITVSSGKIVKWENIPITRGEHYRPALATGQIRDRLEKEVERRCSIIRHQMPDKEYEERYITELRTLEIQSRRRLWRNLAGRFIYYRPIYWPQIVLRPIQRRLGVW
jgi:poly-gamma-glutamate synthesis protein (capsule biosynthesis protein)